jgi:hypothetical protein
VGFFSKDEVPKAPDMSAVINASKDISSMSTGIAQETLDWAKQQFAQNKSDITGFINNITSDSATARNMIGNFQDIANADLGISKGALDIKDQALTQAARANGIADVQGGIQQQQLGVEGQQLGEQQNQLANQQTQLANQKTQQDIQQGFSQDQAAQQQKADQLYDQYKQTYPDAMAKYMADAQAYGSADKVAQARAGAQANVGEQFQGARDAATRQLEAYGVNPASTRFAALDLGTRVKEAAAKAAAGETAARQREQDAFTLQNQAIAQGQQLPGQATAATNAATSIGSNVVGQGNVVNSAGNVANQAGSVAAQFGSLANQAGANANQAGANEIGATNAGTSAINAATGASTAATGANQAATQAQSGALASDTAAMGGEQAAGNLTNATYTAGSQAIGQAPQYLSAANTATGTAGQTQNAAYQNQLAQFKAEQSNSSGLGSLLGTAAGIATKAAFLGDGGSISGSTLGNMVGDAMGGSYGGSASNPLPGLDKGDYGSGASFADTYGLAEGGAIPMSVSPSHGKTVDDVPAQLTAGEFVMPKDVTAWYGEKFFQNLIQRAKAEQSKATAKPAIGLAQGGKPLVVSRSSNPAMGAV